MKFCQLAFLSMIAAVAGCGGESVPPQPPRSAAEVIRECVENSSTSLEAALNGGDVGMAANEIVVILDGYEDSPDMKPFEEFHRQLEKLEILASKNPEPEELKAKVDEITELAAKLLAENPG